MKTQSILSCLTLTGVALWIGAAAPARSELIHRYSFTTDARDSVGTAHGQLAGNGASVDNGSLVLPGGGSSADAPDVIAGYLDLPNGIISVLTNLTIETWVTWNGAGAWDRIFDFGTSAGGENQSTGNGNYLFLSPQGAANLRFAVRDPATGSEPVQLTAPAPLEAGTEVCVTVTYDYAANTSRLFSNAVQVASGPASVALNTINDVNNWLGRSQWGDPMFAGSYREFRIYDSALSPLEVAASYVSGVDTPSSDVAALGPVQTVHLTVPRTTLTVADQVQASAAVDYANLTGISLTGIGGVTYQSDNTSVATISDTGTVTAAGPGTANLSVSYGGKTDSVPVTVSARQEGVVVAGTLYVDLRATDLSANAANWPNKAGKGDFSAVGTPTYEASVAGTGLAGVTFSDSTDAYLGPSTTTDLDGNSDRSIEVWVFNPTIQPEETLVAWAHRGGPNTSNMSFNYGSNGAYGAVGHWGEDIGWAGAPTAGEWHYLVYTYDGNTLARVYADGLEKSQRTYSAGLTTWPDFPIRIGAQANTVGDDFDFGQALSGSIALIRVHGGELTANDVRNNYFYGVELTPPGALNGIVARASTTNIIGLGSQASTSVTADFANRKYLNVSAFSTYQSSDTNVATVDATGRITAVQFGSATITATYQGQQSSTTVRILSSPPPELRHRYSFSEASGVTTVDDSVGNADGTVEGDLTQGGGFTGNGQFAMPGGGSGSGAPYVNLPNGTISGMTNATFEAWVTWEGAGAGTDTWQRIFDFGDNSAGEDAQGTGQTYLFLSPRASSGLVRFAATQSSNGGEQPILDGAGALPIGEAAHVVVSYDARGQTARLYVDGNRAAAGTAPVPLDAINDVNVWLGRSNWGDPYFAGSFDEFRIWEGAMEDDQVKANFTAGPNTIPSGPAPQAELGIALTGNNVIISWPADVTGAVLQETTVLGPQATWTTVAGNPVVVNGRNQVTVPISGTTRFYRLRQ